MLAYMSYRKREIIKTLERVDADVKCQQYINVVDWWPQNFWSAKSPIYSCLIGFCLLICQLLCRLHVKTVHLMTIHCLITSTKYQEKRQILILTDFQFMYM
jgi:hypothetical protein